MNPQHILLHLSLIDGLGPVSIKNIIEKKSNNFDLYDLYNFNISDFINIFGFSERLSNTVITGLQDFKLLINELELIKKHNINYVTLIDSDYPELLSKIYAPPAILYFQGESLDNSKKLALVGSRLANNYCKRIVDLLVPKLVENNWTIVSGGAIGADTLAHNAALEANGKTISVLGSGLLHLYPKSNERLFEKIIHSGGAILSPFPLQAQANQGTFPARNRIISGLSDGCVVLQAAEKSGASITASYALDQGRDVFAIPGQIDDPLSVGCHKLIQQGAKLISCIDDILVEFGEKSVQAKIENIKIETKIDSTEQKIIDFCATPCSIDDLCEKINIPLIDLQIKLFDMQISGLIQQNFAGLWEKTT